MFRKYQRFSLRSWSLNDHAPFVFSALLMPKIILWEWLFNPYDYFVLFSCFTFVLFSLWKADKIKQGKIDLDSPFRYVDAQNAKVADDIPRSGPLPCVVFSSKPRSWRFQWCFLLLFDPACCQQPQTFLFGRHPRCININYGKANKLSRSDPHICWFWYVVKRN